MRICNVEDPAERLLSLVEGLQNSPAPGSRPPPPLPTPSSAPSPPLSSVANPPSPSYANLVVAREAKKTWRLRSHSNKKKSSKPAHVFTSSSAVHAVDSTKMGVSSTKEEEEEDEEDEEEEGVVEIAEKLIRDERADLNARVFGSEDRLLHVCCRSCAESEEMGGVFLACLTSPRPLDFAASGKEGKTPLHLLILSCGRAGGEESGRRHARSLIQAVVRRVESSPDDVVALGLRDRAERTILDYAVDYQLLHLFWPLVAHLPYYADAIEPIPLGVVWDWDWNQLDPAWRQDFVVDERTTTTVIRTDSAATARLCRLSWQQSPSETAVRDCVQDGGADILFEDPLYRMPLLLHFIHNGCLGCVRECLATPARCLDFTKTDFCGRTALHLICMEGAKAGMVTALLHLLLDRLASPTGSQDRIDWAQGDYLGRDFITVAAYRRMLSVVWPVLKSRQVPYFTASLEEAASRPIREDDKSNNNEGNAENEEEGDVIAGQRRRRMIGRGGKLGYIRVTQKVAKSDWDCLSAEDKALFVLVRGVYHDRLLLAIKFILWDVGFFWALCLAFFFFAM